MKRIVFFVFSICVSQLQGYSQKITFSEYSKRDSRNMFFEILGKFDTSFLVYKGINRKHYITSYSNEMKISKTTNLDFIRKGPSIWISSLILTQCSSYINMRRITSCIVKRQK